MYKNDYSIYRLFETNFKTVKSSITNILDEVSELMYLLYVYHPKTYFHSFRVSDYCMKMGREIDLNQLELEKVWISSLMHDIGKIKVPKSIINKPGRLDKLEYGLMKQHSYFGYLTLKSIGYLDEYADLVLYHHERCDGKGYPLGVGTDKIPIYSKMIAVADSFDAMTTERPYTRVLSCLEAFNELEANRGGQFDGHFINVLKTVLEQDHSTVNK